MVGKSIARKNGQVYSLSAIDDLIEADLPRAYNLAKMLFEKSYLHETDAYGAVDEVMTTARSLFSDPDPAHFKPYVDSGIRRKLLTIVLRDKRRATANGRLNDSYIPKLLLGKGSKHSFEVSARRISSLDGLDALVPDSREGSPSDFSSPRDELLPYLKIMGRFAEPFYLSVIEGLSYDEVGQRLGMPVGTVMSQVHRAKECVWKWLYSFAGPGENVSVTTLLDRSLESRLCISRVGNFSEESGVVIDPIGTKKIGEKDW